MAIFAMLRSLTIWFHLFADVGKLESQQAVTLPSLGVLSVRVLPSACLGEFVNGKRLISKTSARRSTRRSPAFGRWPAWTRKQS